MLSIDRKSYGYMHRFLVVIEKANDNYSGPEVIEKLDSIVKVAQDARPLEAWKKGRIWGTSKLTQRATSSKADVCDRRFVAQEILAILGEDEQWKISINRLLLWYFWEPKYHSEGKRRFKNNLSNGMLWFFKSGNDG